MGHLPTMETPDMEAPSFKEGREAEELKKATIITLGEEAVDLRRMDVQIRTLGVPKAPEVKEANRFIKVIIFSYCTKFLPLKA